MANDKVKVINISLPAGLLEKIDAAASQDFSSRSEFFRQAAIDRMQALQQQSQSTPAPVEDPVQTSESWRHGEWQRHKRPSAAPDC